MKTLTIIPYIAVCIIAVSCGQVTGGWQGQDESMNLTVVADQVEGTAVESSVFADMASSCTVSKGKIESVTDIAVYSQMQEQIVKLNIIDGVSVRKGDVLVELDDERLMNQLVQARNSFEQAEYMFEEILIGQGYKKDEFDKVPDYVISIAKVKSGYNTNEASLKQAERNYAKRNVTAPVSGTVTDVAVHLYDLPQSTAPLCRIFDPWHMKVVFNILENERGRLEIGSKVSVTTVAYANEVHSATVNLISPRVDENGMIRIEAELSDTHNLDPGMTAFVNL